MRDDDFTSFTWIRSDDGARCSLQSGELVFFVRTFDEILVRVLRVTHHGEATTFTAEDAQGSFWLFYEDFSKKPYHNKWRVIEAEDQTSALAMFELQGE